MLCARVLLAESMCGTSLGTTSRVQAAQFGSVWTSNGDQEKRQQEVLLGVVDDVVSGHFDLMKLYFPARRPVRGLRAAQGLRLPQAMLTAVAGPLLYLRLCILSPPSPSPPPLQGMARAGSSGGGMRGTSSFDEQTFKKSMQPALDGDDPGQPLSMPVEGVGVSRSGTGTGTGTSTGTVSGAASLAVSLRRPPVAPGGPSSLRHASTLATSTSDGDGLVGGEDAVRGV